MSKLDKLVLLGALFLMVVIFAVAFDGKEDPYARTPNGGDPTVYEGGRTSGALGAGDERTAEAPRTGDIGFDDPVVRGEGEPAPSELHWEKPKSAAGGSVAGGSSAVPEVQLPGGAAGPRDLAENVPSKWSDPTRPVASELTPIETPVEPQNESVLLSGEAQPAAPESDLPAGSILIATAGLEHSQHADFRLYEWQKNDTWAAIAQRYYGDQAQAKLLRQYNEDSASLKGGELVYVPLYDVDERLVETEDGGVEEEQVRPNEEGYVSTTTYAVVEGDSLWIIAKKALGEGARWRKIYDLNRDQLPDENALRPGMQLRLP